MVGIFIMLKTEILRVGSGILDHFLVESTLYLKFSLIFYLGCSSKYLNFNLLPFMHDWELFT